MGSTLFQILLNKLKINTKSVGQIVSYFRSKVMLEWLRPSLAYSDLPCNRASVQPGSGYPALERAAVQFYHLYTPVYLA